VIFIRGLRGPYGKGLVGHCTSGHSLNPPRSRSYAAADGPRDAPFLSVEIFSTAVQLQAIQTTECSWVENPHSRTIRYDTIRDAILARTRKQTWVSLICLTETTKNRKTERIHRQIYHKWLDRQVNTQKCRLSYSMNCFWPMTISGNLVTSNQLADVLVKGYLIQVIVQTHWDHKCKNVQMKIKDVIKRKNVTKIKKTFVNVIKKRHCFLV